jgi:hypothetical protein
MTKLLALVFLGMALGGVRQWPVLLTNLFIVLTQSMVFYKRKNNLICTPSYLRMVNTPTSLMKI